MTLPRCTRCRNGTPATIRFTGTGNGRPISETICANHLDEARTAGRHHTSQRAELLTDDGQQTLFHIGGPQ